MKHANISVFVPHIGCPNRCSFCNQNTISGSQSAPAPQEVERVCREFLESGGGQRFKGELAFFGGSFTAVPREYMESLLQAAQPFLGEGKIGGIRISTRPDAVDKEILSLLKSYGVTAIELGAQSMDDQVLMKNLRGHTAQDVEDASKLITEEGFELGLQMMVGLYGDTPEHCLNTARRLMALHPATVRIYPTVILKGTRLEQLYQEGTYHPMNLEEGISLCSHLLEMFTQAGIRVIRLGLHASQNVEQDMTAGLYHPAFRELCEGEIYLRKALTELEKLGNPKAAEIAVAEGAVSKMVGQKRRNLQALAEQGTQANIITNCSLTLFEVKVKPMGA